MKKTLKNTRKSEQGFTLVELAIVMIIIGLLIGGILKGQELIANAQVSSTVSQIKGLDAATSTFRDSYNSFPGDMSNAANRLANCGATVASCANGDGDGRLDVGVGAAPAGETLGYFGQLLAADLITGMDGTNTAAFGQALPSASVGGGYTVGHTLSGITTFPATMRAGHYLVQTGQAAAVAANTGIMTPTQAAKVDRKLDDGLVASGGVVGDTANCPDSNGGSGYDEANAAVTCSIAVRIQG